MRLVGYRPSNRYLDPELEAGWQGWMWRAGLVAGALALLLAVAVGPRQENVRLRYEIAQLTTQVDALERRHRLLLLEREALTSPAVLTRLLPELGLAVAPPERTAYLLPSGRLRPLVAPPEEGAP